MNPPSVRTDTFKEALRRGRKLMGKPVGIRRGIATVMPDRESGTASQKASLEGSIHPSATYRH